MRIVRVFVSSPGDAADERKRVVRVLERLNAELAGSTLLHPVLWEQRFYSAHDGFQPQIERSAACDVVVAILRGRLGTPLSPAFMATLPPEERLADEAVYASGTAYEILTAISARKRGNRLPDIFVFRNPQAPVIALDAADKAEAEIQWGKMKAFVADVFAATDGSVKGAYQTFSSTDDFDGKIEQALRQWMRENVGEGSAVAWPIETKGSPFRGLEPFGARHADVFRGRDGDRDRALRHLKSAADTGFPFLLVIGPSGAGKSSFVRGGLLPRLVKPGVVAGVSAWRTAVMRPTDHPDGPIASLCRHLFEGLEAVPEEDRGRPQALPELASGETETPDDLAERLGSLARARFDDPEDLARAARAAMAPLARALKRVAEAEQREWNSAVAHPARLLLVVDQLDEVFAPGAPAAGLAPFARILRAMAASGLVWIVATLRADTYGTFLQSPLGTLATPDRGGPAPATPFDHTFSLLPPGIGDMGDLIRGPADAAGLVWDVDPSTAERLDERLLKDIDRSDMLPLVQFVLESLFRRRSVEDGTATLTFAAYRELGRIDGAIDGIAQAALDGLAPEESAALPRLLRTLVASPGRSGATGTGLALKRVPAAEAGFDPASAGLVRALTDARILISGRDAADAVTVSIAHERVLDAWGTAKAIVAESAGVLRIRDDVALAFTRWRDAGRPRERLIAPGLPLSEAESAVAALRDEMPADLRDYVGRSGRAAKARQRAVAAAAAVFFGVAIIATASAWGLFVERNRARQNFLAATRAVGGLDTMVWNIQQGIQNAVGLRLDTVRDTLEKSRRIVDDLAERAPGDPELMAVRVAMLDDSVGAYRAANAFPDARTAADEALEAARALVAVAPDDPRALQLLAMSLYKQGDVRMDALDVDGAVADDAEAATTAERLVAARPADAGDARTLWTATEKRGEAELASGAGPKALATLTQARGLAQALADREPDDPEHRRDLAISLGNRAGALAQAGDEGAARAELAAALRLRRALAAAYAGNLVFSSDLVSGLVAMGQTDAAADDGPAALAAFDEALTLARALAAADPTDASLQRLVAVAASARSDVETGDAKRADLEASRDALRARAQTAPDNLQAQLDLARALAKLALAFDAPADGEASLRILDGLAKADRLSPLQLRGIALLRQQLRPQP